MEAVKPFLHTLVENRCYTAHDLLYNVRGVSEMVSWNIPIPLAKSIYSVIQDIHAQSTHISKRNILRQVRISSSFEQSLQRRATKQDTLPTPFPLEPVKQATTKLADCTLVQVKFRLETEVLGLPLSDESVAASEVLFKAAFLVDGSLVPNSYQAFLNSLLTLQATGNSEKMRELIADRIAQARAIADGYLDTFELFGVENAKDLLKNNLAQILISDDTLLQKVIELVEPLADSSTPPQIVCLTAVPSNSAKLAKPTSLSPLIKKGRIAMNSFASVTGTDIIHRDPTSILEQPPGS
ncbi:unnamed protein product [Phytophthora lilii]|uniref:Unnamed protein product n=1 Tax=Phytophthora lilii TaxID=2077276 RepID=A0A9W6UAF0_9STRA|nr:unnamed protein product [Phytophthora lilii]